MIDATGPRRACLVSDFQSDSGPQHSTFTAEPSNIWPLTSLATSQGPKWGVGVRQALFPNADIRRRWGCRLPDAILHGKRSHRPRSRAVQRLAVAGFLSEASRPAMTDGCATGPRTRPRHAHGANSASWPFAPGRPPLLAVRWPEATGLTSYLSGCLALTSQRCGLSHRRRFGSFHRTSACVRILPGASPHFICTFRRLWLGGASSARQSGSRRAGTQ